VWEFCAYYSLPVQNDGVIIHSRLLSRYAWMKQSWTQISHPTNKRTILCWHVFFSQFDCFWFCCVDIQ
jgi:hypothetical protein